jgi:diguanylate cyclase (GGDEF)-like protein
MDLAESWFSVQQVPVYQKLKTFIFTAIYLLLWVRFFFMAFDPSYGGLDINSGLSIYRDWAPFLAWMYLISGYLMMPVYWLYGLLDPIIPDLSWFPGTYTSSVYQSAGAVLTELAAKAPALSSLVTSYNSPLAQQAMVGYLDFLVIPGVIFYRLLHPLLDRFYDFLKNVVWNVLIEFSFTKRKEARYQEALEKRAADLMKLNVEYKNLSKEASMLATSVITDELTKVYNKRFFINKITQEFNTAKDKKTLLAMAMVDIDHFKKLNDNYGHLLGDKVLQAVAQVAKRGTPGDCFCCRFGGEEFAIIMPGKNEHQALEIVSGIHRNIPLLRFEEDPDLRTSASFGVCIADFKTEQAQQLKTFEDFIKIADDGLYKAKLNGRNRVEHQTFE